MAANMNRIGPSVVNIRLLERFMEGLRILESAGDEARNIRNLYAAHMEIAGPPVNVLNIPLASLPSPNNQHWAIRACQLGFFRSHIHHVNTTSPMVMAVIPPGGRPGGLPGGWGNPAIQQAFQRLCGHMIEFYRYLLNTALEWGRDNPFKAFLGASIGVILCYSVLFPSAFAVFSGALKLFTDKGITPDQLNNAGNTVRLDLGISLQINSFTQTGAMFTAGMTFLCAVCDLAQAFISYARGNASDLQNNEVLGNLNNSAIREITDIATRTINDQRDSKDDSIEYRPSSPRPR